MTTVTERLDEWRYLSSKLCRMGDEEHICFDGGSELREAANMVEKLLALIDHHSKIEKHNEAVPINRISELEMEPSSEDYLSVLAEALGG